MIRQGGEGGFCGARGVCGLRQSGRGCGAISGVAPFRPLTPLAWMTVMLYLLPFARVHQRSVEQAMVQISVANNHIDNQ